MQGSTALKYDDVNAENSSKNIRIVNNNGLANPPNAVQSFITLAYVNNAEISNNYANGYSHGMSFWGGNLTQ